MKKIFIILNVVLFGCTITSCSSTVDGDKATYHEYFIDAYLIPTTIDIRAREENHTFEMNFKGNFIDKGEQFETLAKLNNDNYKRYRLPQIKNIAFAEPLNSVKIITRQDFDAQHSAGTDISDLVQCEYRSYYKYVQSGFTIDELWEIIKYRSADINASNTQLMDPILWLLSFLQKPIVPGTYAFDLIFTFETVEVKGQMTYEFK